MGRTEEEPVHPPATRTATATVTAQLPCVYYPELYFAERPQDLEWAKTLCRRCQIRAACLAGALERGEPAGVWGGELLLNGKVIDGKRPRGRPRKAA